MSAFDNPAIGGGESTEEPENVDTQSHDLSGSVTPADYDVNNTKQVGDRTVNATAFDAAGSTTGDREIGNDERAMYAERIDVGVRSYRAWLDSRPLAEQIELNAKPVIHVPEA